MSKADYAKRFSARGRPKIDKITAEIMLRYTQGEPVEQLAIDAGVSSRTITRRCKKLDGARKAWQLKQLLDHNYNCIKGPLPDLLDMGRKNDAMIAARMQHMLENPDMHIPPNVLYVFSQINERIGECELARRELEDAADGPKRVGESNATTGGVRLVEGPSEPADD